MHVDAKLGVANTEGAATDLHITMCFAGRLLAQLCWAETSFSGCQ